MSLQTRLASLIAALGADVKFVLSAVVETAAFSKSGPLEVSVGQGRYPIKGGTFQVTSVAAMVGTAPTGSSLIVDVLKNGATIYATSGNRPTVSASATSATVGAHAATTVTTGDYLSVNISQVGSSTAGSDLVVVIRLLRLS